MVYQVSGIYPLQRGRQTHCQVTMRCMSANLILLIIQYFGLNVKYIFAVWSFPRGRFFLPKLKHWDSKTDYSLDGEIDKIIRYCYENPVRKGLVAQPKDYPYWRCKFEME